MKILNAEQMNNIDRRASERFGVPSIVLMENAAAAVVDAIFEHYPTTERVAIFCGTGKNGGDGFAVARHLENRGVVPILLIAGDRTRCKGDALTNLTICERLGLPMYDVTSATEVEEVLVHAADADVLVDAIFGTGLNRAPEGLYADLIQAIAELRLPVIAVDLPSGLNASSAEPFEPCLQAEVTVTFAAPKMCHVFEPAALYCGEVIVADISIPEKALDDENVTLSLTTPRDMQPLVPMRLSVTHKGSYGHVAIVAGSMGRTGAAVLAARGAVRGGAGLVSVVTDRDVAPIVHAGSVESMTFPLDLVASLPEVLRFLANKSAVLVGPGLRDDEETHAFVRDLVAGIDAPLVIDASGLNAFAGRIGELSPRSHSRVITPHPGELSRLLGKDTESIQSDRVGLAREAAHLSRCVVVLKGHQTLIAEPDGHVSVNPTGNPGMASGGMGDVLGGAIAALLAGGHDSFDAARLGAYLHGLAGDILREEMGDTGLTALDLADRLPLAVQRVREP